MSSPPEPLRSTRSSQWPAARFWVEVLLRTAVQVLSLQVLSSQLLRVAAVVPSGRIKE
jgi:hypothetical protein